MRRSAAACARAGVGGASGAWSAALRAARAAGASAARGAPACHRARPQPRRRFGSAAASWSCVETPNPDVRKFERLPLPASASAAASANLTGARGLLLELDGVRDVFVASGEHWVAVTRAGGESWDALEGKVQAVLHALPADASGSGGAADAAQAAAPAAAGVEADIEEVLEHRVRPGVQADGGDVELSQWDAATGRVTLRLRGACRGCPQSAVTLQETILRALQHYVPQVRSVVAEEEELVPDESDPFADLPWAHEGLPDPARIKELAAAGTPFFSTFAGTKMEGAKLRRVKFFSHVELAGRTPGHIFVSCVDCKARRTIEDPQDLMRRDKGNTTGNAAVVICPTCCVLISP